MESASRTCPSTTAPPPSRRQRLLPRGRPGQRARRAAAARLPLLLAHVPRPDPPALGRLPRHRPGLSRVRPQRGAGPVRVRLHLRPPGRRGRRPARPARNRHVRDLRDGLRRAVGFRLALRHPERLSAIIVQNAPLYPVGAAGLVGHPGPVLGGRVRRAPPGRALLPGPGRAARPVPVRRPGPLADRPG
jgi:hypothetical protein